MQNGVVTTDQEGMANITFSAVTDPNQVYAFIAYAHLDGLEGLVIIHVVSATDQYVVPIVQIMASQDVALANSYDINNSGPQGFILKYNATFIILKQDYTVSELSLESS